MQLTDHTDTSLYERVFNEAVAISARMDLHVILAVVAMTYLIKGSMKRFREKDSNSFLWCPVLLSAVMTPFISLSFEVQQEWDWFFYIRAAMLNSLGSALGFIIFLPRLQKLKPDWFGVAKSEAPVQINAKEDG